MIANISNTDKRYPPVHSAIHIRLREITEAIDKLACNCKCIKTMHSDITEVKSQIDRLLSRKEAVKSGLEQDIAQLISGDFPQPTPETLSCIHQLSLIEDRICEEPFNLQRTIESLEDYRTKLEPSLAFLAKDPELQQEYQNAFKPSGWNDSFEVRSQHFIALQLLRQRILRYSISTEETGETSTQES